MSKRFSYDTTSCAYVSVVLPEPYIRAITGTRFNELCCFRNNLELGLCHPSRSHSADEQRLQAKRHSKDGASRLDLNVRSHQSELAAATSISVGRMMAAAITSRHSPAKACSMVTKPHCWYSHATRPTEAPAAVKPMK